jgi:hypothetical protein
MAFIFVKRASVLLAVLLFCLVSDIASCLSSDAPSSPQAAAFTAVSSATASSSSKPPSTSAPMTMDEESTSNAAQENASSENDNNSNMLPQLPASTDDDDDNKNIPRIQLGESISFERLGPIILNSDGTTRTIDNWSELSESERAVAWRRIAKRNADRREALLLRNEEEQDLEEANGNKKEGSNKAEGKDEL